MDKSFNYTYVTLKNELCYTWIRPTISDLHHALENIADTHHHIPVIPTRQIYNCQSVADSFNLLEKWRILSKERLCIIVELCRLLKVPTGMIESRLEMVNPNYAHLASCICQKYCKVVTQPSYTCDTQRTDTKNEEVYEHLSENLGDRWIDLARKLPGMRGRAEEIRLDCSFNRQKDKIILILEEFEARSPGNTLQIILNTLKKCELNKQYDYIIQKYSNLL